jgi:hypothetical protein
MRAVLCAECLGLLFFVRNSSFFPCGQKNRDLGLYQGGIAMGVWIAGIFCTVFGALAVYAAKKGWLK